MASCNYPRTSSTDSCSLIKHYVIIWLDSDSDHANENTKKSFDKIRHIVHSIQIFLSIDDYVKFLRTIKKEKIFMIIGNSFEQEHVRLNTLIEETIQIESIYIFSNDPLKQKHWETKCKKCKGIFNQVELICDELDQSICPSKDDSPATSTGTTVDPTLDSSIRQSENSSPTTSTVTKVDTKLDSSICQSEITSPTTTIITTVNNDLDELDQSYMYSKILTEIIYKIEYDTTARKASFDLCRKHYAGNDTKLKQVDEFERDYAEHSAIWWYTKESPISTLLRDALIKQDIDMMISLGFFMRDLHQEIKKLHIEMNETEKFIVYRGQRMQNVDFEKFIEREGGLYAFHNFISTSTDKAVGLHFATPASVIPDCTGILFQMEIDPSVCSSPFASLNKTSYYLEAENEVLFSTNTVFRIGKIEQNDLGIWLVNLTLTDGMDEQMKSFIHYTREEMQGVTHWHSLATFLFKMGKYEKAIEIFDRITELTNDDNKDKFMTTLAASYNNIGLMYDAMEQHTEALAWYEKAHEVQDKSLPPDHSSLAVVYNNIGMAHRSMGDYTQALSYCEKTLEIRLKSSSSHHTSLTTIYSNIGMIYESKGDYVKALSNYEKAYEIQKSFLPTKHPSFILSYNNFGGIYSLMGKYSIALSYYEKTNEIQCIFLPPDHPSVAITFNNIGRVYQLLGNYGTSLSYYKDALAIQVKIFTFSNQLSLAATYNNIGLIYRSMGNYPTALTYFEKTLGIEDKCLSSDHPSLADTYNNLAAVRQSMGEHSVALIQYKKTLRIWQKCLPSNHPSLATIYNNIGSVHDSMKEYPQALSNYQKSVEIQQDLPSSNQLDLASTYSNLGEVYRSMKDYPTALSYYKKALEIEEKDLSPKHPSLAITLSNMAVGLEANNQLEEAYEHAERALDILCISSGSNHAETKEIKKFLDELRPKILPQQ